MNDLLFIETKATVFGGQKALLARCVQLEHLGIGYTIIHPFIGSEFLKQYKDLDLKGEIIAPQKALGRIGQSAFILRKLLQSSVHQNAQTIHCDAFDSAYLVAALRKFNLLRHQKLIFTVRSERYLRFNAVDRFLLNAFDQLCTNSAYSKTQINAAVGQLSKDISVTFSPIDLAALPTYTPVEKSINSLIHIGYVGSFDGRKRLDRFVDFGLFLKQKMPDNRFQFHIYGEAKTAEQKELRQAITDTISEQNAQDDFVFWGYCPAAKIAEQIDILFCPFDNEPLGRVVPEFLYMGRPVIAHDAGGLREAGAGYATMISGHTDVHMREQFVEAVHNIISKPIPDGQALDELRQALLARFGRAAVVDSEIAHYRMAPSLPHPEKTVP